MEESSINLPDFELKKRQIKVRVVPYWEIGFNLLKVNKYLLPNSAYGEWLIYQEKKPKFYYNAINEDGTLSKISQYIKDNDLEFESFLVRLLRGKGYKNVYIPKKRILSITFEKRSYIENIELFQILDAE